MWKNAFSILGVSVLAFLFGLVIFITVDSLVPLVKESAEGTVLAKHYTAPSGGWNKIHESWRFVVECNLHGKEEITVSLSFYSTTEVGDHIKFTHSYTRWLKDKRS